MKENPRKRVLHLTLHRKWFTQIWLGVKKEEYREAKPYWTKRLMNAGEPIEYDLIQFRNGYQKNAPTMVIEWSGIKPKIWNGMSVYAIQLGAMIEAKNIEALK